jgi:hypothetical protein
MRWFTEEARDGSQDLWDRAQADYAAHLATIAPRLPVQLAKLAMDPAFDLHDGRFQEVSADLDAGRIAMTIACGDLQSGYRSLTIRFDGARIFPDETKRLAEAVGAEFRANHWHQQRAVTEVLDQEVDLLPDGRFVLRLRLWPFYEFAVEFSKISVALTPLKDRPRARAGRFHLAAREPKHQS